MEAAGDFIVFADESGDHGLDRINPDYPVFVLSCCVFDKTQYVEHVCPELQRFKLGWWQHDAVVLHSSRIKRQEPPFAFLTSVEKRARFLCELTEVLRAAPFRVIAAVIDKQRLRECARDTPDLYALALRECVAQLARFLHEHALPGRRSVSLLIEKRGKREDAQLGEAFREICKDCSAEYPIENVSIEFIDKKANLAGLQIADLVGTPIGRRVMKPHVQNRAFDAIQGKLWVPGDWEVGEGDLRILPTK